MSMILEQAEELRLKAIRLLNDERKAIDEKLALLGANGTEIPAVPKPKSKPKANGKEMPIEGSPLFERPTSEAVEGPPAA